jgi:hypothetical protein
MFYLFEPVVYLNPVSKFQSPETIERPEYVVGFTNNLGDALTFKIFKNDKIKVSHRKLIKSAVDNPKLIISFSRKKILLDKMPFLPPHSVL